MLPSPQEAVAKGIATARAANRVSTTVQYAHKGDIGIDSDG